MRLISHLPDEIKDGLVYSENTFELHALQKAWDNLSEDDE